MEARSLPVSTAGAGASVRAIVRGLDRDRAVVPPGQLRWHDLALAGGALAVLLVGPWVWDGDTPDAAAVALAFVMAGALAVRRVWPVVTLVVVVAAAVVWVTSDRLEGIAGVVIMVALITVGNRCPLLISVPLTAVTLFVMYVIAALSDNVARFDTSSIWLLGWLVAATGAGIVLRSRRAELAAVLEREAARCEQEAAHRVDQERLRIAQDLHDTVGHTVATVSMQAGVAAHVIDHQPEQAKQALETIADVSKQTLSEIRSTLGMLRSGSDETAPAEREPVSSLADVARVFEGLRAHGIEVDLERTGTGPVPAPLAGVLYRITQEATTNVLKHAEGVTRVRASLVCHPSQVELTILDDGAPLAGPVVEPPGHHGLQGMQERARALGGTLTTEARPEGGFAVRAVIPTGEST